MLNMSRFKTQNPPNRTSYLTCDTLSRPIFGQKLVVTSTVLVVTITMLVVTSAILVVTSTILVVTSTIFVVTSVVTGNWYRGRVTGGWWDRIVGQWIEDDVVLCVSTGSGGECGGGQTED